MAVPHPTEKLDSRHLRIEDNHHAHFSNAGYIPKPHVSKNHVSSRNMTPRQMPTKSQSDHTKENAPDVGQKVLTPMGEVALYPTKVDFDQDPLNHHTDLELEKELIQKNRAALIDSCNQIPTKWGSDDAKYASDVGQKTPGPMNEVAKRLAKVQFDQDTLDSFVSPERQSELLQEIVTAMTDTSIAIGSQIVINHLNESTSEKTWWSPDILQTRGYNLLVREYFKILVLRC